MKYFLEEENKVKGATPPVLKGSLMFEGEQTLYVDINKLVRICGCEPRIAQKQANQVMKAMFVPTDMSHLAEEEPPVLDPPVDTGIEE
jgi:hypothetical protein